MSKYTKHQIERFYELFRKRSFDQDDVSLFLITTREHFARTSVFRELGNFLAHPDRDQGLVFQAVKDIAPKFEQMVLAGDRDVENRPIFQNLDQKRLLADLRRAFERAGLEVVSMMEDSPELRDFVFCLVFLLSASTLAIFGQLLAFEVEYAHSLRLSVTCESRVTPRYFARLTVLSLNNVQVTWSPSALLGRSHVLKNYVARRLRPNGCLAAISHANDLVDGFTAKVSYAPGEAWPLPDFERASRTASSSTGSAKSGG